MANFSTMKFSFNNVALVKGRPRLLSLKEIIGQFVDFRHEVVVRRTKFELDKAQKRAHIVEGLLKAMDLIDEIVHIIRYESDVQPGAVDTFERNVALCADPELKNMLLTVSSGLQVCEGGQHIMTDDRAPVELLGMRVIDDLIRDEISWIREVYEREGLQGAIGSL